MGAAGPLFHIQDPHIHLGVVAVSQQDPFHHALDGARENGQSSARRRSHIDDAANAREAF
jgi:hypothetical protein